LSVGTLSVLGVGIGPAGYRTRDLLEGTMLIDCDACAARGPACGDCVVTVLLGAPPVRRDGDGLGIDLDGSEQAALAVLAGSGLVPPLRLVAAATPGEEHVHDPHCPRTDRKSSRRPHPDDRPGDERRTAV
jgi:hypothetical protein